MVTAPPQNPAALKQELERELRSLVEFFKSSNDPYEALQRIEAFNSRLEEIIEKFKQVSEFIQYVVMPKLQKYKPPVRRRGRI